MILNRISRAGGLALAVLFGAPVWADDVWEEANDDGPNTLVHLLPGQVQAGRDVHVASPPADEDWVWIATQGYHSYEARAIGGPVWAATFGGVGAKLERLDQAQAVQQTGNTSGLAPQRGHVIRWTAGFVPAVGYLRVSGWTGPGEEPLSPYALELYDTTYALPRS